MFQEYGRCNSMEIHGAFIDKIGRVYGQMAKWIKDDEEDV